MSASCIIGVLLISTATFADTVTLRDGTILHGTVLRMDADSFELRVGESQETYLRSRARLIEFESSSQSGASPGAGTGPGSGPATIAAGTRLVVKLTAFIDSAHEPIGQVFSGRLEEPVSEGARLLVRMGAPVLLQLQSVSSARQPNLRLQLIGVRLDQAWANVDVPTEVSAVPPDARLDELPRSQLAGDRVFAPSSTTLVFTLGTATSLSAPRTLKHSNQTASR